MNRVHAQEWKEKWQNIAHWALGGGKGVKQSAHKRNYKVYVCEIRDFQHPCALFFSILCSRLFPSSKEKKMQRRKSSGREGSAGIENFVYLLIFIIIIKQNCKLWNFGCCCCGRGCCCCCMPFFIRACSFAGTFSLLPLMLLSLVVYFASCLAFTIHTPVLGYRDSFSAILSFPFFIFVRFACVCVRLCVGVYMTARGCFIIVLCRPSPGHHTPTPSSTQPGNMIS